MSKRKFKLQEGEKLERSPNQPIMTVVGFDRSSYPYLWIGNNNENDKMCFATLSGRKPLRQLAEAILKAIE